MKSRIDIGGAHAPCRDTQCGSGERARVHARILSELPLERRTMRNTAATSYEQILCSSPSCEELRRLELSVE